MAEDTSFAKTFTNALTPSPERKPTPERVNTPRSPATGKYSSTAVRVVARTAIVAVGLAAGTSLPR
jgi:hypothetical protein